MVAKNALASTLEKKGLEIYFAGAKIGISKRPEIFMLEKSSAAAGVK